SKTFASGLQALKNIDLDIRRGEIFALLGPNGAGKTTLISTICGIVNPTEGSVTVGGHDIIKDFRAARSQIGLVPQELTTDAFESVWATVSFSRGLFGMPDNPDHITKVLKDLSLWDRRNSRIMTLSGGMKRRVLIAKALSHEPQVLFLDEPTAGVDVELRQDMWEIVRTLRASGVTIILTTHYIEEAEEMAARRPERRSDPFQGSAHDAKLAGGHFRRSREAAAVNFRAVRAIYLFEMSRTGRTLLQSIVSPVISTSLYFIVFGAAIGARMRE